jgi:DNA mismatch repair ATPase MutS
MVELGFIRSGEFVEAYGESAFAGADEPDHRVSTDAHGCSMTGFPVAGLGTLMERIKRLGLSFAIVEQMGDSGRRGRKVRAVTHVSPESHRRPETFDRRDRGPVGRRRRSRTRRRIGHDPSGLLGVAP